MAGPLDTDALVPPALRDAVLAWYDVAGRALAFRATRDPYAVLVSELMAQQTQAERAAEAWTRWMARFPTVRALAAAPTADVVRAWAGLGYNRRAVNLHRAAKVVMAEHGGRLPDTVEGLMTLPGVGPYTARAVAAIAFGRAGRGGGHERAPGPRAGRRGRGRGVHAGGAPGAGRRRRPGGSGRGLDPRADGCRRRTVPRAIAALRRLPGGRVVPLRRRHPRRGPDDRASARPCRDTGAPPTPVAFPATTRWLRGRIVARARDARDGDWVAFDAPIGGHDRLAVREAVAALAADGLLEARETPDGPEARLPVDA